MTPCPDEAAILAFGRGDGDPPARRAIEAHMAECDECSSVISTLVRSSSMLPKGRPVDLAVAPTFLATPIHNGGGAPVKVGDTLAAKYVVERILGAGERSVVVAVRHLQLEERFALKFLLPAACTVPEAALRFLREGKAAAGITSEHVARVVDTGVLDTGAPFLVMEYLEGKDLASLGAALSPEDAVEYVLQAGEAIVEAHQLGIVHRDLKPANLFLAQRQDGSPLVKVLDFGISKIEGTSDGQVTRTSTMMGSPQYMSPEQIMSTKDVDARTDVWALGVILFELVAQRAVWQADTVEGVRTLITTAPTPSLRAFVPTAPPLLDDVIRRCLAKDPIDRVASVADLALLLAPLASAPAQTSIDRILRVAGKSRSTPIARPPAVGEPTSARPAAVSQIPESIHGLPQPASGGRVIVALAAVIALIALGAGGALLYKRGPSASVTVSASAPAPTTSEVAAAASASSVPAAASAAPSAKATKPRHRPPVASAIPPAPTPAGTSSGMGDRK